jgi:integrase
VALSGFFGWLAERDLVGSSPVTGIKNKARPAPRERTLTDAELQRLWQATADGSDHSRIVRLLVCTGCRRAEIGQLAWAEVVLDHAGGPTLVMSAARMKQRRQHLVPLSPLAVAQLPAPREGRPFVFGRRRASGFSGWSGGKADLDARLPGFDRWVLHDLRKTAASRLGDLGTPDEIIERLLGHAPVGVTRTFYNHSQRLAEVRAALERWAEHLQGLVGR